MKVLCVLVLFVASTAMAQDFLPEGVNTTNIFKQTCINWSKAKEMAAQGPGDCASLANVDPNSETKDDNEIVVKFGKLLKGYKCFMEKTGVRNADGTSDVEKLKKVIGDVAISQEKAAVIKTALANCTNNKATIAKENRLKVIICVLEDLLTKKTCHPDEKGE